MLLTVILISVTLLTHTSWLFVVVIVSLVTISIVSEIKLVFIATLVVLWRGVLFSGLFGCCFVRLRRL